MIKIVFCLRRRADLSPEAFRRYWREVHAPLVRQHKDALRIARYVQVHADHGPVTEGLRKARGTAEPYDGIAEVWYESREILEGLGRDEKARAAGRALLEDEKRFIDFARSSIWVGEEVEVIPGSSGAATGRGR